MKFELEEKIELTDSFFENHTLGDVIVFKVDGRKAQGPQNKITAIIKENNKFVLYHGDYDNNESLREEKVKQFFYHIDMEDITYTGWKWLNMGLGHGLYVRDLFYEEYLKLYDELIKDNYYYFYKTWLPISLYILQKYFNNIEETELFNNIKDYIKEIE